MPAQASTHKFQVELTNIKLPPDVVARIDAAVNRAVLSELAHLDLKGDYVVRHPKEWRGIWADFARAKLDRSRFEAEAKRPDRING